jgi:hypothetical protein
MLVVLGGRDRTQAEYAQLLDVAGFAVADTVVVPQGISVVTAVAR